MPPIALGLALIAVPLLGGEFVAYQVALFLIYGIATQGVALCWGRLGILSLGHALFFGLGAYVAGGIVKADPATATWLVAVPLALAVPTLLAYGVARLIFARSQQSGPYFSLITLAMTMLGFLAAQQWGSLTGGFNGMTDIPELPGTERYSTLYWVVAVVAVISTALLGSVARRPIGVLWSAVALNEERLQLLGYATDRVKAAAFALSALVAAAAGVLFAAHQGIVTPLAMGFLISTEFVIWAAVGGKASALGALAGAVVVGYASSELRDHFAYWEVGVAALFIVVVRFLPQGIAGVFARMPGLRESSDPGSPLPAPARQRRPAAPSLSLEAVATGQGGVRILDGLSLRVAGRGIACVIGPNGAGKTSMFNVMTGKLPVRGGRIVLDGIDVSGEGAWRMARRGVGRKLQIPSVFATLSVRQNLLVALWSGRLAFAASLARSPLRWSDPLLEQLLNRYPALREKMEQRAGSLSQGQRQALEFIMTVLPQPRHVLLDEPCAGLSPAETHQMVQVIQEAIGALDASALIIEHDISAVATFGGTVFVLHQGRLLAQGTLAEIQADPQVQAVYAGGRK